MRSFSSCGRHNVFKLSRSRAGVKKDVINVYKEGNSVNFELSNIWGNGVVAVSVSYIHQHKWTQFFASFDAKSGVLTVYVWDQVSGSRIVTKSGKPGKPKILASDVFIFDFGVVGSSENFRLGFLRYSTIFQHRTHFP